MCAYKSTKQQCFSRCLWQKKKKKKPAIFFYLVTCIHGSAYILKDTQAYGSPCSIGLLHSESWVCLLSSRRYQSWLAHSGYWSSAFVIAFIYPTVQVPALLSQTSRKRFCVCVCLFVKQCKRESAWCHD